MRRGLLSDFRSAGDFILGAGSEVRSWLTVPLALLYMLLVVLGTVFLDAPEVILSKLFFMIFAGCLYVALGAEDRPVTVRTVYSLAACHASLQWLFGELLGFPLLSGVIVPAAISQFAFALVPLPLRGAVWTALLAVSLHGLFALLAVMNNPASLSLLFNYFGLIPMGAALIPIVALARGYPQDMSEMGTRAPASLTERRKLGTKADMDHSFVSGGSGALISHAQAWIEARLRGEVGGRLLLLGMFIPSCVLGAAYLATEPQPSNVVSFILILAIEAGGLSVLLNILQMTARERGALTIMGRFAESTAFVPEAGVQLFVWLCRLVCREPKAIVIEGSGKTVIHEKMSMSESRVDRSYALALLELIERSGLKEGVLTRAQLPSDLMQGFDGWCGIRPTRVLFIRIQALSYAEVRSTAIVLPLKRAAFLLGLHRSYQTVVAMASLLRLAIADIQQRGGEPRRDLLVTDEGRVQRLVHRVNNGSQEVLSLCAQLSSGIEKVEGAELRGELTNLVHSAERSLAVLSWGVSDDRVLAELQNASAGEQREDIAVHSVADEYREFGRYLEGQSRGRIEIENSLDATVCVKVMNREFLLAALRQLGWELKSRDRVLRITFRKDRSAIECRCEINAPELQRSFASLAKVAELSGGRSVIERSANSGSSRAVVWFPLGEQRSNVSRESGQWALFVDDNQQVTAFYGKAAEALGLNYRSAHGLGQARELVTTLGRPRLVITDVNLGAENGLDLVKYIREQFGADLPILVVSGERLEGARDSGRTKYLVKPVGRRALFAEISAILGS